MVSASDHFVDRELKGADEVVTGEIVEIVFVINIVNLNLILFAALKVVLDIETLHPSRIKVIHDDFSHAHFLPLSAHLLVKD